MAFLSIVVTVPIAIGTYVYRTSDLLTLWEYPNFHEQMKKYEVVGYEVTSVRDSEGGFTNTIGNAIVLPVQIGELSISYILPSEYVPAALLTETTTSIESRITAVTTGGA